MAQGRLLAFGHTGVCFLAFGLPYLIFAENMMKKSLGWIFVLLLMPVSFEPLVELLRLLAG